MFVRICGALCVALFLLAQGCAKDLTPSQEQPIAKDGGPDAGSVDQLATDGPPKTRVVPGQKVVTKSLGRGVNQVTINSSDEDAWIYYSFSFNRHVEPDKPGSSSDWDIGFQRFKIKSNGGISGKGGVVVAHLDDRPFESIRNAPATGFVADKEDGDDEDKDPDYAFLIDGAWYVYNPREHTLKPRKRVYILRDVEGQYYKIEFLKYYDENGNSGFPTFKWAKILPPKAAPPPGPKVQTKELGNGVTQVRVNAAEASKWIYFSFLRKDAVAVDDPQASSDWALGFQRFQIKSNGGINGKRGVLVAHTDKEAFGDIKQAPKDGFVEDKPDGDDADEEPDWGFHIAGAWFAYDPKTHSLAPRKRVYFVKVGDIYYKLQMTSYYEGNVSGLPTFKWAKVDPPQ